MPTTRLMQLSSTGEAGKSIDDNGKRSRRPLSGISSHHFLKLIEERGQIGFWTSEFATNHMTISVGLYRLFGIDPSIPLNYEDMMRIIHPDDRSSHQDMHEIVRSGHAIDREFRIIRPDGTMRWLQNKAEVLVDRQGHPARAAGVMIDVTDKRSALQSVKDGWQRHKTLIKAVAGMDWRMTANGDIAGGEGWHELTGQTAAEAAGWGWLDAVHPDDRERMRSSCTSPYSPGEIRAADHRILCADGRYRWFLARVAPIVDPDGTIREWVGALFKTSGYDAETPDRDEGTTPLNASHIRAARALLNWTINDLAFKAGISVSSVRRMEAEEGHKVRDHLLQCVRDAFQASGVSFTSGPRTGDVSIRYTAGQG